MLRGFQYTTEKHVHPRRVRLSCGGLHDLADEEPERRLLAAAVLSHGFSIASEHLVDQRRDPRLGAYLREAVSGNDLLRRPVGLRHLLEDAFRDRTTDRPAIDQRDESSQAVGWQRHARDVDNP